MGEQVQCPLCRKKFPRELLDMEDIRKIKETLPNEFISAAECYIDMFYPEPPKKLMRKRETRIWKDFAEMVRSGSVRWKGKPARPMTITLWRRAIEAIHARSIDLPLSNHNYLIAIAYDLGDKELKSEKTHTGNKAAAGKANSPYERYVAPEGAPATPEEIREIRKNLQKTSFGRYASVYLGSGVYHAPPEPDPERVEKLRQQAQQIQRGSGGDDE